MNCFLYAMTALALAAAVTDGGAKAASDKPVQPVDSGPAVGKVQVGRSEMASEVNLSPKVPPMEYERRLVLQILRLVRPGQTDTRIAEAALHAAGKHIQPILQELKEHPEKLVSDEDLAVTKYLAAGGVEVTDRRSATSRADELRKQRLQVVETMLTELAQGFAPRRAIETWAFPRGGAPDFLPEPQPVKVPDLAKLFPDYSFYAVVFLLALDKLTGKELWKVARDEKSNWSTPVIWKNGLRTEIVTTGSSKVRSYDLLTFA